MKVKLFSKTDGWAGSPDRNQHDVEKSINEWLDHHPAIRVVDIKQSFGYSALFISVWYEETD